MCIRDSKNAGRYDRFMRKDRAAYDEMYVLIRPVVKAKTVLELATGTGLIAKHIVNAAAHIEATDASAEMIAEAKRDNHSAKLYFSVQDMFLSLIHIYETLCCHAGDEENLRRAADEGGRDCEGLVL